MRNILTTAIFAVLLISCQKNKPLTINDIELNQNSKEKETGLSVADSAFKLTEPVLQNGKTIPPPNWTNLIIKTGNVVAEVSNYNTFNTTIHQKTTALGAYIATEEQTQTDEKIENNITIKVPVQQFEGLMNSFSTNGVIILERKITSEDVTGVVADNKARTESKKQIRQRYIQFLQQAKNIDEVLQVQEKIDELQETIESNTGHTNYLVHQAAYSTIHLRYYQPIIVSPTEKNGFLFKVKEALSNGIDIVGSILLVLISLWPLILLSIIIWIVWKKRNIKIALPKNAN
jgi:hypothetical protein